MPSATVEGPTVQVLKYRDEQRLVVALPQSAIQNFLSLKNGLPPTIIAESQDVVSQVEVYTSTRGSPKTLSMKNGLPYLSKDLFWQAMEDIAGQTTLVSGHPWPELRDMIHEQVERTSPEIHAVHAVVPTPAPSIQVSYPGKSVSVNPHRARHEITRLFDDNQPKPNANRWRLSGVAKSLTFGAQTGRGSDNGCVIKRTLEQKYATLSRLVHQTAQSVVDSVLSYLSFQNPDS